MNELDPSQESNITGSIQRAVTGLEFCSYVRTDPMTFAHAWALKKNGVNFGLTVSGETVQDISPSQFYDHLISHNLEDKVIEAIGKNPPNKILVRTTEIVLG